MSMSVYCRVLTPPTWHSCQSQESPAHWPLGGLLLDLVPVPVVLCCKCHPWHGAAWAPRCEATPAHWHMSRHWSQSPLSLLALRAPWQYQQHCDLWPKFILLTMMLSFVNKHSNGEGLAVTFHSGIWLHLKLLISASSKYSIFGSTYGKQLNCEDCYHSSHRCRRVWESRVCIPSQHNIL